MCEVAIISVTIGTESTGSDVSIVTTVAHTAIACARKVHAPWRISFDLCVGLGTMPVGTLSV
jgi:hypothetical protein